MQTACLSSESKSPKGQCIANESGINLDVKGMGLAGDSLTSVRAIRAALQPAQAFPSVVFAR